MNKDRLSELISRKLAGEATPAELEELDIYLQNHPGDQYFTELLTSYWTTPGDESPATDTDPDGHFNHILQMADDPAVEIQARDNRYKIWIRRIAVAALLVITVGFASWLMRSKKEKRPLAVAANQNETVASKGIRSKIVLPDGSLVLLNSGTKLKYPDSFSDTSREVYLDGEAFFDIVKDSKHPFIVHTAGMDIKVLGTAFNVKAYPGDKQTETSLIRGSIEVIIKNESNDRFILSPSEKLVVMNKETEPETIADPTNELKPEIAIQRLKYNAADSTVDETQWVENKLVFNDESFSEVAVKMERWYNVEIEIRDNRLKEKRLTGNFEKETIDQALEALTITNSFSFERTGNKIIIHH
ncbi:MAG TPA: FecR domain-containing protein [Chitinophagaceae bacterium]